MRIPDKAKRVRWIEVFIPDDEKLSGYRVEHYDDVTWWLEDDHLCIYNGLNITRYPDVAYDKFTEQPKY